MPIVGGPLASVNFPPRTLPRTASRWAWPPAAMRHASLDLTVLARPGENVYADPTLLDVAGAMEVLPELELHGVSPVHASA